MTPISPGGQGMMARLYRGGAANLTARSFPAAGDAASPSSPGSPAAGWTEIGGESPDIPASWLREAVSLWQAADDRYLEQHPEFMRANDRIEGNRTRFFETRDASGLRAYAAVEAGFTEFAWQLGAITLFRRRFRQLRIVRGPVFARDIGDSETAAVTAGLLLLLHARFRGWPIYLEAGRPAASHLADARLRAVFLISPRRPPRARYAIDLPESAADYLKLVGSKRGQDIRRNLRRLETACDGDIELLNFRRPEEVETFLAAALPLARQTYQYRLYAAGPAADPHLAARSRLLAGRGWWRGTLLRVRGGPAAFVIGYQLDGTYFDMEMGYDPAFADLRVGRNSLFLLIRAMFAWADRPARLDFGHGAYEYKRRLGTVTREEEFHDFIPRRSAIIVLHLSFRAWTATTRAVLNTLKRHGIRTRRQRFRDAHAAGQDHESEPRAAPDGDP